MCAGKSPHPRAWSPRLGVTAVSVPLLVPESSLQQMQIAGCRCVRCTSRSLCQYQIPSIARPYFGPVLRTQAGERFLPAGLIWSGACVLRIKLCNSGQSTDEPVACTWCLSCRRFPLFKFSRAVFSAPLCPALSTAPAPSAWSFLAS